MNLLLASLIGITLYAVVITILLLVLRRNGDTERADPSDDVRIDSVRGALDTHRDSNQRPHVRAIS